MARSTLPSSIVQARKDYEVKLKLAGLSSATITKQINAEAKSKGWLPVSLHTVDRDIAEYFRKNQVLQTEDYDHLDRMREALLAQMEISMEKLAMHVASKQKGRLLYDKTGKPVQVDSWKPFEMADALEKLHKMQMNFAELQNWNFGRKNLNVNLTQNNINAVFESADSYLNKTKKSVKNEFIEHLRLLQDKMKAEEEENGIIVE